MFGELGKIKAHPLRIKKKSGIEIRENSFRVRLSNCPEIKNA